MHIAVKCQSTVFSDHYRGFVVNNETILTDHTDVTRGNCGTFSSVTLSDLILVQRTTEIPSWAWTTSYLATVNGLTYPISLVGDTPYIRGVSFLEEYVPHMQIDLLHVPFINTKVALSQVFVADSSPTLPSVLNFTLTVPVDNTLLFLGGLYIPRSACVSDGTTLTVTLPADVITELTRPRESAPALEITNAVSLLAHPGSFLVKIPPSTVTQLPMGKNEHPLYGTSPAHALPATSSVGHILSYRPNSPGLVRFRYCHIVPISWLKIERI